MDNKPCMLRVMAVNPRGLAFEPDFVRDRDGRPLRYRSVRQARARLLDATANMSAYTSCSYVVDIVTVDGETRRVSEAKLDYMWRELRADAYHNSIGARLRRGEAVAW